LFPILAGRYAAFAMKVEKYVLPTLRLEPLAECRGVILVRTRMTEKKPSMPQDRLQHEKKLHTPAKAPL
jgi:hypothetical protein